MRIWSAIPTLATCTSRHFDEGIARLETFAKQHAGDPDLAARAYLRVIDCLWWKGDLDAGIAKAKWLAGALPKARAPQFVPLGSIPRTMAAELREYVDKHPIYIKDFAWAKVAELCEAARRTKEQLAAYDHILTTVPPDPLPDTKNLAIVVLPRLHRDALAAKAKLLQRLRRSEQAKEAESLREKLYPSAEWQSLLIVAKEARRSYLEESGEPSKREPEAELRRLQELEDRARREREAEERARRRREEEMRARDEERRQKYLKRKRESSSSKKQAEPPASDPPPAPKGSALPPTSDASAVVTPRMPDREEATPSAARTALSPTPTTGTQRRPAAAPPRAAPAVVAPVVAGLALLALLAGAAVLFARKHRRQQSR